MPLFVFDPATFGRGRVTGLPKVGAHRARFLLQAVADLRARLRAGGSDLLVRSGSAAEVVPSVARALGASAVFKHGPEVCTEERAVELAAEQALRASHQPQQQRTQAQQAQLAHLLGRRHALPPRRPAL